MLCGGGVHISQAAADVTRFRRAPMPFPSPTP